MLGRNQDLGKFSEKRDFQKHFYENTKILRKFVWSFVN